MTSGVEIFFLTFTPLSWIFLNLLLVLPWTLNPTSIKMPTTPEAGSSTSSSHGESSRSTVSYLNLELPPIFTGSGTQDFSVWSRQLEAVVQASPTCRDLNLATILPSRLGGAAFSFWDNLPAADKDNFDKAKEELSRVFGRRQFLTTFQSFLNARPRYPNEPLEVFASELRRLVWEAFPTYDETAKNGELFRRFVAGLDPALQVKVHEHGSANLPEALKVAGQVERAQEATKIYSPATVSQSNLPSTPKVNMMTDPTSDLARALQSITKQLDDLRVEMNYIRKERDFARSSRRDRYYNSPREPSRERSFRDNTPDRAGRPFRRSPDYYRSPATSPGYRRQTERNDRYSERQHSSPPRSRQSRSPNFRVRFASNSPSRRQTTREKN